MQVKIWAKQHRRNTLHHLQQLELNIKDLHLIDPQDVNVGHKQQQLKLLESERNTILLADEALWRQRCKNKWIQCVAILTINISIDFLAAPEITNTFGTSWTILAHSTVNNKI
jgi:hypothetical protein